jgi:hypothetical protein
MEYIFLQGKIKINSRSFSEEKSEAISIINYNRPGLRFFLALRIPLLITRGALIINTNFALLVC